MVKGESHSGTGFAIWVSRPIGTLFSTEVLIITLPPSCNGGVSWGILKFLSKGWSYE